MAFNIADLIQDVSRLDTGKEQIEYIKLDKLQPDPNNFYELSDIAKLAENIETIGLQQPLRVRKNGESYQVVTGHRRREAALKITEEGGHMFDEGIACIVEDDEVSSTVQELRLIFANSANRVLTASELSRQAVRVEELLYQLQEEGYEFPGRMRDHVAEACNMSKTKIARLHAIRENLSAPLLRRFDENKLPESTAYELQKLPEEAQELIAEKTEHRGTITMHSVQNALEMQEKYLKNDCKCPNGDSCYNGISQLACTASDSFGYERCPGGCCLNCREMNNCRFKCATAKAKVKQDAENEKAEKEKENAKQAIRAEAQQKVYREGIQAEAKRIAAMVEGWDDGQKIPGTYANVADVRRHAAGIFEENEKFYTDKAIISDYASLSNVVKTAEAFKCSIDYLIGREVVSKSDTEDDFWHTGEPTRSGTYLADLDPRDREGTLKNRILAYSVDTGFWSLGNVKIDDSFSVPRWAYIPE